METHFDLIWDKYDHFIFDCDGVLISHKMPIGNCHDILNYLQKTLHKSVYILSNYSGHTFEDFNKFFDGYDLSIPNEHIYYTASLVPKYLSKYHPEVKTVYYFGYKQLRESLEKYGYKAIGEEDNNEKMGPYDLLIEKVTNRKIDAVVVGYDHLFNAYKMYTSSIAIAKGAKLFATNTDLKFMVGKHYMADTGAILSTIEISTGKKAEIIGKPSKFPFDVICEENGIKDRSKVLMIGDTIETDIEGAFAAGIDGCLIDNGNKTSKATLRIKLYLFFIIFFSRNRYSSDQAFFQSSVVQLSVLG